jgi:SpoVK/Ycf46/Vps4 family AAA+-type ATPase
MESFDGVFIATTNFNKKLDHAVARRFDFKIKLDYLMPEQSIKMFKQLSKRMTAQTVSKLSTLANLTPGDFAVVSRKTALLGKHKEIEILDLLIQESEYKESKAKQIGFVLS